MPATAAIVPCALAYLIGSIPFGLLLARLRGIDIRTVGSGNIGATNVFRCVGKPWGILVFVLDFSKGTAATLLLPHLAGVAPDSVALLRVLCGVCAVAGHNWPVTLGFKGGKGIATTAGVLMGIAPLSVAVGLLAWLAIFLASGFVSLASILAAVVIAASSWWLYPADPRIVPITLTVLAVFAVWRHKANIRRLREGTESRFAPWEKRP